MANPSPYGISAAIAHIHRGDNSTKRLTEIQQQQEQSESEDEDSDEEIFDKEYMKKKLNSAWNNMKYGVNMNIMPRFSEVKVAWMLGKCYRGTTETTTTTNNDNTENENTNKNDNGNDKDNTKNSNKQGDDNSTRNKDSNTRSEHTTTVPTLEQLFSDFSSLIWLTYRKNFEQLPTTNLTSDGGWGCTLRTSQMLLANSLLIHTLHDGWTSQVGKGGVVLVQCGLFQLVSITRIIISLLPRCEFVHEVPAITGIFWQRYPFSGRSWQI